MSHRLLMEIRAARSTFDNTKNSKRFGPVVVQYSSVRDMVADKYDRWHRVGISLIIGVAALCWRD